MRTGTSHVAPIAVPDPDDPRNDLAARVHSYTRGVIEAETQRLSRRVPSLSPADLNIIDAALQDLSESLILHRLRNTPRDTAPLLWRLFDTATKDP